MGRISFEQSLMEFNKRVLAQGYADPDKKYSLPDLQNKLFFNKIFLSNTQEMFYKYNHAKFIDDYADELNQYSRNISAILNSIILDDDRIVFGDETSFEHRFAIFKNDASLTQRCTSTHIIQELPDDYFKDDVIYYMAHDKKFNKVIIESYAMASDIYSKPISYIDNGKRIYWKTDNIIREYLYGVYGKKFAAIRVMHDKHSKLVKAEYNGDTAVIVKLLPLFNQRVLIIKNPYIYTGDIDNILSSNIISKPVKTTPVFTNVDLDTLAVSDIMCEYPKDSFQIYLEMLNQASMRSDVRRISVTLYRIGDNPTIYKILKQACENNISVHVNIELEASGEIINKFWYDELKRVGVDITAFARGELKVHSKLTLIEFNNETAICQIGTGNYHTQTVTQYTDLSLFTRDPEICSQVRNVFKLLRNKAKKIKPTNDLLVTKFNCRNELTKLIHREATKGDDGYISIKCNSLNDEEIIHHLEEASHTGCNINLIIRGVCTWIPDKLPNVSVKSVIWDKLEHSRVFCFGKTNPTIYIGSLDLVTNKLDKRIETLVRIKDPLIAEYICDYMNRYITNTRNSWIQTSSGMYIKE